MGNLKRVAAMLVVGACVAAVYVAGLHHGRSGNDPSLTRSAHAQETGAAESVEFLPDASPTKARPASSRQAYFPGTEDLGPDEMRVIACGTGMPTARPKQAATCYLVELGNGDKFLFDLGTGCAERLSALRIPWDYLNKAFLSHLHTDHFGDFDAVYVGGWVGGRNTARHSRSQTRSLVLGFSSTYSLAP